MTSAQNVALRVGGVDLDAGHYQQQFTVTGEGFGINHHGQRRRPGIEAGKHFALAAAAGFRCGF